MDHNATAKERVLHPPRHSETAVLLLVPDDHVVRSSARSLWVLVTGAAHLIHGLIPEEPMGSVRDLHVPAVDRFSLYENGALI